jgi:AraC-like DNA-binding protein
MAQRSQDHKWLQSVPRPVSALAKSYPPAYADYAHHHSRAQFLYAESGSMRLTTGLGCWIIPPKRAVWIPAGYIHQAGSIGALEMRTLFIDTTADLAQVPSVPRMLRVSALLHELVLRVVDMPHEYDEADQDGRVVRTLLGEIDWTPIHPVSLPSLRDKRLRRMEQALLKNHAEPKTLEQWAAKLGMSPRTLTRLFRKEIDLTFQSWRDQLKTFVAIPMLTEGRPLAEIPDALGYDTAWAFTAMFKRVTGKLPSKYTAE